MKQGLIYVFSGEGKGKTSAALGVAVRSALTGKVVDWIAWYKQASWDMAEKHLGEKFANLHMNFVGRGFLIAKSDMVKGEVKLAKVGKSGRVVDTASKDEHIAAARNGLELAERSLETKPFLLVMDEVLNAIADGLLTEKEVLEVLNKRGETHIILTGRGATEAIMKAADLVTECKKIKHPYDSGKLAVRGLDF